MVTNADLEKMVETTDDWIQEHTGIRERHVAEPVSTSARSPVAGPRGAGARRAQAASELDLIIIATSSPDYQMPGCAHHHPGRTGRDARGGL